MKIQDLFEADNWAKKLAQANRDKAKRERELAKVDEKARLKKERDSKKPMDAQQIWSRVESSISNSFPDGDPIDHLGPWMERSGVTMDQVNAAVKKFGKAKDLYGYLAVMWDDFGADQMADAKSGHVDDNSPFYHMVNGKPVKNPNPWK